MRRTPSCARLAVVKADVMASDRSSDLAMPFRFSKSDTALLHLTDIFLPHSSANLRRVLVFHGERLQRQRHWRRHSRQQPRDEIKFERKHDEQPKREPNKIPVARWRE